MIKQKHRIAFIGASGTGKTTLTQFLADELLLTINPVGSRSVAQAMGFASPYDVDKAGKRADFQRRVIREKVVWEAEHDEFVVDRTTFDNLVYTMMHDVSTIDDDLLAQAQAGIRRYTTIIYCPYSVFCDLGDDPARMKSAPYQYLFDTMIEALLRKHVYLKYHRLESKALDLRKQELREYFGIDYS